MDPLSISASIITILQLTGKVVQYLNNVKGGDDDRKRILDELTYTHVLLFQLKDLADREHGRDTVLVTMESLALPKGPLEQVKMALEALASKLAPVQGLRKLGKALLWPFEKGEIKEILATIERQKTHFSLALQKDHMCDALPSP